MLGFIITRHVNSEKTNQYWIESYISIRKFYPTNTIMIIDDNSNNAFVKIPESLKLSNCYFITSEYPQCGELLAYYYFHKYPIFEKAVFIHDSVFVNQYIDFSDVKDIKFLWHFQHDWDEPANEKRLLEILPNTNTLKTNYDNKEWFGAFGVQAVITREFLSKLANTHQIFNLLPVIKTRNQRMNIERIFGLLCSIEKPELFDAPSLFGTIHSYIKWGYTFEEYKTDPLNLPLIKVWSGR